MNVGELIEALSKYDKGTMVVVRGYEGGVNTVVGLQETKIVLNRPQSWGGQHTREEEYWDDEDESVFTLALEVVGRYVK